LASVYLGHRAAHRRKGYIFPRGTKEYPGGDQPIHPEAGQETSIEGIVLAGARRGIAVVEAANRPAEQGIRQERADGISGARADWHIVNELVDAVIEIQD